MRSREAGVRMIFERDGIRFSYRRAGEGIPFVYQHGLGADVNQPFNLFKPPKGFQLLGFDCRLHGETTSAGDTDDISIATFADDMLAFLDLLEIEHAIVGGISMGAAVALNFALRFPRRTRGLVLHRPAWLDGPNRRNAEIFGFVAKLIKEHDPDAAVDQLRKSTLYADVFAESPDCANSLVSQCVAPRARERASRLERITSDAPNLHRAKWCDIKVPVLVLANRQDPIHPFEFGQTLAREIPHAEFREVTSKSVSVERYARDVQRFLTGFLTTHFAPAGPLRAGANG